MCSLLYEFSALSCDHTSSTNKHHYYATKILVFNWTSPVQLCLKVMMTMKTMMATMTNDVDDLGLFLCEQDFVFLILKNKWIIRQVYLTAVHWVFRSRTSRRLSSLFARYRQCNILRSFEEKNPPIHYCYCLSHKVGNLWICSVVVVVCSCFSSSKWEAKRDGTFTRTHVQDELLKPLDLTL